MNGQFLGTTLPLCAIFAIWWPKRFMMRHLIMLIASVSAIHVANAQRYLSFDEAVSIAFDSNLALKSVEYDISVADYQLKATEGLYFPKIEIVGGYILTQRDVAIDILGDNGIVNGLTNTLINSGVSSGILTPDVAQLIGGLLSPLNSMDLQYVVQKRSLGITAAKVTLPIYAGGKIRSANRAAAIGRRMAEQKLIGMKSYLYTTLVEQYYGVVVLQYAVDVRRSVVDVMQHHLSDAKAMEEAGSVAHSVVLGVEYRLAEAERELSSEQHRLHMAERLLNSTLDIDYDILIADRLFVDRVLLPLDYYIDNAIKLNPLLSEANLGVELANEGVRVAKADLLPEVAAMGLASIYSPNLSDMIPRWAVGIEARIPLFDGLGKENRLRASKAKAKSVEMIVEKAQSDIRLVVENEYYNVVNALNDITTAESSMRLSESYYQSAEDGFKAGVTSSTELMDAELGRSASKLSYINAVYNYCLSLARLLEASGLSHTLVEYRDNGVQIDIE